MPDAHETEAALWARISALEKRTKEIEGVLAALFGILITLAFNIAFPKAGDWAVLFYLAGLCAMAWLLQAVRKDR